MATPSPTVTQTKALKPRDRRYKGNSVSKHARKNRKAGRLSWGKDSIFSMSPWFS